MKKGKGEREQELVKYNRMARLSKMMLRGHTSQSELAAMIGVSQPTVSKYMGEIIEGWIKGRSKSVRQSLSLRVKQLELAATWSADAWEKSQQNEVEVRTTIGRERCGSCRGTGMSGEDEWCVNCEGEGTVETETTVTTVSGSPGDPAFLRLFKDCVAEAAKLQNLYRGTNVKPKPQMFDGVLKLTGDANWAGASPEDILVAKEMLESLRNGNGSRIIDARMIGTETEEQEG